MVARNGCKTNPPPQASDAERQEKKKEEKKKKKIEKKVNGSVHRGARGSVDPWIENPWILDRGKIQRRSPNRLLVTMTLLVL